MELVGEILRWIIGSTIVIAGLLIIDKPTYRDDRGFFREAARLNELEDAAGISFNIKQWNHSVSKPRVIRGLHAEGWNKLIYPITGERFSALVDVRPESKTFGKVETFIFKESEPKLLFIPEGVANSVCVIGNKPVHYFYLVDKYDNGGQ
ncbi:MAG: dTDP-4-dehydrorhamnose 3,5-epimerase family protein [Patescibacteria group bacterium]